jgi:O-antigen/teichoic acid export membrane protein
LRGAERFLRALNQRENNRKNFMFLWHSVIYLFARGVPCLISFLSVAIYTRLLTPGEFGVYALIYTAAVLLSSVCFQWLRMGLLRFYQESDEGQRMALVSTIALLFLVVAAGLGILSLPVMVFSEHASLILVGLLIGLGQGAFDILLERLRAELSPLRFGLVALSRAVFMLAGGIAGFKLGGVRGLLAGVFLGLIPVVAVELIGTVPLLHFSMGSRTQARRLLHYGLPLTLTFAFAGVVGFSDRYMLAGLVDTATAGTYAAAYDITQKVIITLMMVVNLAGYPLILRAQADGEEKNFQQSLKQTLAGLLFIGIPAVSAFVVFPREISDVFLGASFRDQAAVFLPWLGIATLAEGLKCFYFDLSFQLRQNTFHQVWIVALAALFNVGLNFWLIPTFHGLGAAWATLAANGTALILSFVVSRSQIRLPLFTKDVPSILTAAGSMLGVLLIGRSLFMSQLSQPWLRLFLLAAIGSFVYFFMNFVLNTLGAREEVLAFCRNRGQSSG